jgi:hypothetical protein
MVKDEMNAADAGYWQDDHSGGFQQARQATAALGDNDLAFADRVFYDSHDVPFAG